MFWLNKNLKEVVEASQKKCQDTLTTSTSPQTHTRNYVKIYKDKNSFDIFKRYFI